MLATWHPLPCVLFRRRVPLPATYDTPPWRPGSPVMTQCKLGRPGRGWWRGSRERQHPPGVRRGLRPKEAGEADVTITMQFFY
jgi:hypothetical protein